MPNNYYNNVMIYIIIRKIHIAYLGYYMKMYILKVYFSVH